MKWSSELIPMFYWKCVVFFKVPHGFSMGAQVDRIVEVPQITSEERIVEVVQREVREIIKQVPKPAVQYVDKILS